MQKKQKKNSTSFVMVLLIYNGNCIGFNGKCNGAYCALLVIECLKKKLNPI